MGTVMSIPVYGQYLAKFRQTNARKPSEPWSKSSRRTRLNARAGAAQSLYGVQELIFRRAGRAMRRIVSNESCRRRTTPASPGEGPRINIVERSRRGHVELNGNNKLLEGARDDDIGTDLARLSRLCANL